MLNEKKQLLVWGQNDDKKRHRFALSKYFLEQNIYFNDPYFLKAGLISIYQYLQGYIPDAGLWIKPDPYDGIHEL